MILVTLLCVFTRLVFTFLHSVDGACTFVLQHLFPITDHLKQLSCPPKTTTLQYSQLKSLRSVIYSCVFLRFCSLQKGELKLDQLIQHRTSVSAQRLAAHTASVWQLTWYKRAYSLIIVIYSAAWPKFNQYWDPNFLSRLFFSLYW